MLAVHKLKQQRKTRNTTCAKFLRQNKNALTMTQGQMQTTLLLSKSLGENTCTREKS